MINRAVRMNYHTNLLELEEHMYPLVDVETPNVFHNLFPYSEVPKIAFNDRIVPHHMPDDIWITDTTFRTVSSPELPIPQSRLCAFTSIFIVWAVRTEKSARVNFFFTVKKTGTR